MVKSPKGDFTVPVKVVTKRRRGRARTTSSILACKGYDLDSAMDSIAPAVGPDTTIVPMLNGHAHFATLDARFGAARVAGGLARISGMLGPNGEILHSGASGVSFGERDGKPARQALVELDAACKKAGIDGGLNANINQDLWDKWVMLGTIASMCAAMRGTVGDIVAAEDGAALMRETLGGMPPRRRGRRPRAQRQGANRHRDRPDAAGRQGRGLDPGRHGEGRRGRGRSIVGDMLMRARKAGHRRAQPALRLRPSAGL